MIAFALSAVFFTGCVNFDKIVQKDNAESIEDNDKLDETGKVEISLGDINYDGKIETLVMNDNVLIMYSGSRICKKIELSDEYNYTELKAIGTDLDNDFKNEIVAMITCDTRDTYYVSDIVVFDEDDKGNYELWDFPNQNTSGFSEAGVRVDVSAKDKFIYLIEVGDKSFDVDVSNMYDLSLLDKESLEKVEEQWDKMKESNYHGEAIGIYDVYVIQNSNGIKSLNICEYLAGGDDKIIGSLIISINYDKNAQYSIGEVWFR